MTPLSSTGSFLVESHDRLRSGGLAFYENRWATVTMLAALALTVFEGAIRKWIIGTDISFAGYLAYFSKDIVFVALLVFPTVRVPSPALRVFRRWLIAGTCFVIVGATVSSFVTVNLVGSGLTMRALVLLPIIAYLVLGRVGQAPLRTAALLLAVLTLANFGLGVQQNSLPFDNQLNRYAASTADVTAVDTGVRASGTFAYIAGMGVISLVGIWAGMVLLSLGSKRWDRLAGWVAVVSGFGCSLVAVSRAPVIIGAAMLIVWGLFYRAGLSSAFRIIIAGALLGLILLSSNLLPTFSDLGEGLLQRQETAGDSFDERAFGQFEEAYEAISMASLGNGLGTEQIGGNYYAQGVAGFTTFESQLPRIVMETGILGLAGFLIICAGAITTLQVAKRNAAAESDKSILLATQLFLLSMFYTNVIFNHTASAFVWLIFVAALSGSIQKRTSQSGSSRSCSRIAA